MWAGYFNNYVYSIVSTVHILNKSNANLYILPKVVHSGLSERLLVIFRHI